MSQLSQKGYLLATASGVAAAAVAGNVAQAQSPAPTWTGWYVGVNAGASWQTTHYSSSYTEPDDPSGTGPSSSTVGFIGGGQIGYNWQNGNYVFGLGADFDGLVGSKNSSTKGGKSFSNTIRWLSTVRGRVGTLIDPQDLIYVTGGVAFAGVRQSYVNSNTPKFQVFRDSTQTGWTAGFGAEHMVTGTPWTVGLEFLYVDLGNSSLVGYAPHNKTGHFTTSDVIGRINLSYKW